MNEEIKKIIEEIKQAGRETLILMRKRREALIYEIKQIGREVLRQIKVTVDLIKEKGLLVYHEVVRVLKTIIRLGLRVWRKVFKLIGDVFWYIDEVLGELLDLIGKAVVKVWDYIYPIIRPGLIYMEEKLCQFIDWSIEKMGKLFKILGRALRYTLKKVWHILCNLPEYIEKTYEFMKDALLLSIGLPFYVGEKIYRKIKPKKQP